MTFGEKLQRLRKEAGLSQEELAGRLHVSRQAVSKWERNESYPETEKLIRMGQLFDVTLDELLQEKREMTDDGDAIEAETDKTEIADAVPNPEVVRKDQMIVDLASAESFLDLQKKKTERTAAAAGLLIGSLAFSFLDADAGIVLFLICFIAGMVVLFSVRFMDDPFWNFWKTPLALEREAEEKVRKEYERGKGRHTFWNLAGIVFIAVGLLICPVIIPAEQETLDMMIMGMGMILAGAGVFCCACMAGWRRAYRLLLFNENFQNQKGKRRK